MEKTMGSLLNSLVILSLLFGFISATTAASRRPATTGRFWVRSADGADESSQEIVPRPESLNEFLSNFPFPGFNFGRRNPPPENSEPPPEEKRQLPPEWKKAQPPQTIKEKQPQEKEEAQPQPQPPEINVTKPVPPSNGIGLWVVHSENAGVSAMHIQLMPNNKAVWYDSTSNGISEIELKPRTCKPRVGGRDTDPQQDCTAHAIEYDVETAEIRPLKINSSPWCSSGGLSRTGNLISTGGDKDGLRTMRILKPCPNCDFEEDQAALYTNRWYSTQVALEDGTFVVIGGRNSYNYEIIPPDTVEFTPHLIELPLIQETDDDGGRENNLYPFVNLLPDGNLFVFANYKSVILNPTTGETLRHLPDLPGGARNYPASGMSALLPINLNIDDNETLNVEVIVCGGNTREAYRFSDLQRPRKFLDAARDCGRLKVTVEGAQWEKEEMPSPRVMGDMLLLPNGDVLLINGAKAGTSAWNSAENPNLTPVLYSPNKKNGERFKEMAPTTIARMYHSVSAVLPDGKVLIAGSNTNEFYKLQKYGDKFIFPTELRVEKFSPPYLAPEMEEFRLEILEEQSDKVLKYGNEFKVQFRSRPGSGVNRDQIKVTMYSPPFTTHGYSMNQRLLILKVKELGDGWITLVAPPSGRLAPPGYYLLFLVHGDVPSRGMWVHIE